MSRGQVVGVAGSASPLQDLLACLLPARGLLGFRFGLGFGLGFAACLHHSFSFGFSGFRKRRLPEAVNRTAVRVARVGAPNPSIGGGIDRARHGVDHDVLGLARVGFGGRGEIIERRADQLVPANPMEQVTK